MAALAGPSCLTSSWLMDMRPSGVHDVEVKLSALALKARKRDTSAAGISCSARARPTNGPTRVPARPQLPAQRSSRASNISLRLTAQTAPNAVSQFGLIQSVSPSFNPARRGVDITRAVTILPRVLVPPPLGSQLSLRPRLHLPERNLSLLPTPLRTKETK